MYFYKKPKLMAKAPPKPKLFEKINNWYNNKIKIWIQTTRKWDIIALAALGVSIFTYFDTRESSSKQEAQWNAVNLARVSVTKAKFFTFRTVTREEMIRDSLYAIQDVSDDDNTPNTFMVKYLINAFDNSANKNVMSSAISMNDFIKEMNWKKENSLNKTIVKVFNPVVTIKNVGQTTCTIDSIIIHDLVVYQDTAYHIKVNQAENFKYIQHNFTLEPGQEFINATFRVNAAYAVENPILNFHYDVYYKNFKGDTLSEKVLVNTQNGGFWLDDLFNSAKLSH